MTQRPDSSHSPSPRPRGGTTRRRFLALGTLATGGVLAGARFYLPFHWRARPVRPLAGEERELVERCFAGLERAKLWDAHVHLVGLGAGGTGCEVAPEMRSHLHPLRRLQYDVYTAAAGIEDEEAADQQYLARLLRLHRAANPAGKLVLFAFDRRVGESGEVLSEGSPFFTPNDYVLRVAAQNEDVVPCASVHPYRRDALERLDRAASGGARAVKWLPNAMGIDPASPRCDAFYERLAELDLPLVTHAGRELAVDSARQELGNPLRLRRALDAGARVVVAHFACLGESADLDAAGDVARESFELCMRLFREERYEESLFADVSAVTFTNRFRGHLGPLLRARSLHPRLVNGSDYPLPAVDPVLSTWLLERAGFLTARERRLLDGVYEANPLLFDFAVKRCVALREGGREHRFADSVFETAWLFGPRAG